MRTLETELDKLIEFAKNNDNIRALVLQGSFVNDSVATDEFSDLDPLFFVNDLSEFIERDDWKLEFGKPISGFSDDGDLPEGQKWYTRLTIYSDGFKIDFGFQSVKSAKFANEMKLYKIYLDKDGILPNPEVIDERKFYVKKPTEAEFLSRMNAFFYDSSYVVKALARNEIFFAKEMDYELHRKIKKLLDWYIGLHYDFKVNPGLGGRYYERYLDEETWVMLLKTYGDSDRLGSARALLASFTLVRHLGKYISDKMKFSYPEAHNMNMLAYCEQIILDKLIFEGEASKR